MSTFFRKGKKRKRKPTSMWDIMQNASVEVKESGERVRKKRAWLEERGVEVDTSHLAGAAAEEAAKSETADGNSMQKTEGGSMWETMSEMERMLEQVRTRIELEENALDDAIVQVKAGRLPVPKEKDLHYAEKKLIAEE